MKFYVKRKPRNQQTEQTVQKTVKVIVKDD